MKSFYLFSIVSFMLSSNIINGQIVNVLQVSNPALFPNTVNNPILKIEIQITSTTESLSFPIFNSNGSSILIPNLLNSKLFYSGSDSLFDIPTNQLLSSDWYLNVKCKTQNVKRKMSGGKFSKVFK